MTYPHHADAPLVDVPDECGDGRAWHDWGLLINRADPGEPTRPWQFGGFICHRCHATMSLDEIADWPGLPVTEAFSEIPQSARPVWVEAGPGRRVLLTRQEAS